VLQLSVLFKQVYIQTYAKEGVTKAFANFIQQQFSEERITAVLKANKDSILVATNDGNPVGATEIVWNKPCLVGDLIAPEISKLYVLQRFSKMGIGGQLLQAAEELVKSKGIPEMWLVVWMKNEGAIRFYERHDWEWIGHSYFQIEANTYKNNVMLKKLNP
jgi:ribosomal protein S18 acetylase RimI-like enzyme